MSSGSTAKHIARYIAFVALVYTIAIITVGSLLGYIDLTSLERVTTLWPVPLVALGFSAIVTLASMWQPGDTSGSIYFIPTVTHVALLLMGVILTVSELWHR